MELLIAERLDRRSVEDAPAGTERMGNLIFTDQRLAAAGLRRDQDILVATDGGDGVLLEAVQCIRVRCRW